MRRIERVSATGGRGGLKIALIVAVLATFWMILGGVSAQEDGPNRASPARIGQAVIAQGVSEMPGGEIAWRVVRDTADQPGIAGYDNRALGFIVALDDAVLVSSESTGLQVLLAAGEAAFVPDGSVEKRESMGAASTPIFRIGLVPREQAGDASDDEMILAGSSFPAPDGRRDLSLVSERGLCMLRDSGRSITRTIGDLGTPRMLVLATDGLLEVKPRDGEFQRLRGGEAIEAEAPVIIRSLRNTNRCSSYVVAVIGPRIP